jgi:hypothetical protein
MAPIIYQSNEGPSSGPKLTVVNSIGIIVLAKKQQSIFSIAQNDGAEL